MSWHDDVGEDMMINQIIEQEENYMENTNERPAPIFMDGVGFEYPSEKAPEYILLKGSMHAHKLFTWAQQYQNEKGYVNFTIKKAKSGKIYGELDTWKPNAERLQAAKDYNNNKYSTQDQQNQKEAAQIFDRPLDDAELASLSDSIPF